MWSYCKLNFISTKKQIKDFLRGEKPSKRFQTVLVSMGWDCGQRLFSAFCGQRDGKVLNVVGVEHLPKAILMSLNVFFTFYCSLGGSNTKTYCWWLFYFGVLRSYQFCGFVGPVN